MYENYEIIKTEDLGDISSKGTLLRHKKTGARVALISNTDENKVFSIAFRTPVNDSTGVPHIIEHTVLCGSEKFPIKDPFIELAKGSLNTFLNAMTFPDKTMYPVASTNDKDFDNLMDVYLDAVFYPNIYKRQEIFKQEGWHYEIDSPEGELTINGVVYNEMKGSFSSPESMLEEYILQSLYPETGYGLCSGGDPDIIPELTYENYLDFHRRYYHPSNSYIFIYGDCNMDEKLKFIDENYLSKYDNQPVDSVIKLQKAFAAPIEKRYEYPIASTDDEKDSTYLSYNVAMRDCNDVKTSAALGVIEYALFDMSGAPVKKALIDAGIGQDILVSYDASIRQPFFMVTAKNANEEDKERFLEIIRTEIKKQIDDGINKKSILAAINMNEFSYREADFGGYPKGLIFIMNCMENWLHDDNMPFDAVKAGEVFDFLREKLEEDDGYFENITREYLLENNHAALVILAPKKGLTAEKDEALKAKLSAYKATLSSGEIDKLIEETKSLKEYQSTPDSPEELECLPLLTREDMNSEPLPVFNEVIKAGDVDVVLHDIPTNGIAYISISYPLNGFTAEDMKYLSIVKAALGEMDTRSYSYDDLTNEINLALGCFNNPVQTYTNVKTKETRYYLDVAFKALVKNVGRGFELAEEIVNSTKYKDNKRLKELIMEGLSKYQMTFMTAGHTVASLRAMSYFSEKHKFKELVGGYDNYTFIKDFFDNYDEKFDEVADKLVDLAARIFAGKPIVSLTVEKKYADAIIGDFLKYNEKVTKNYDGVTAPTGDNLKFELEKKNEGLKNAAQIQYVCRAGDFSKHGFEYTSILQVFKTIMSYEYMWQKIRVLGGAYGCMCNVGRDGESYFVSYRDPNLRDTNDVFEGIPQYLESFACDDRDMTKYLIGTMGRVDTPLTPSGKGTRSMDIYMEDDSLDRIRANRKKLLAVTQQDIRDLAPLIKSVLSDGNICVVGNEEMIEKDKDLFMVTKEIG